MRKSRRGTRIGLAAIGRRIRELRGFDMTQAEFARRVQVAQSYLSALERGEKEPGAAGTLPINKELGQCASAPFSKAKETANSLVPSSIHQYFGSIFDSNRITLDQYLEFTR